MPECKLCTPGSGNEAGHRGRHLGKKSEPKPAAALCPPVRAGGKRKAVEVERFESWESFAAVNPRVPMVTAKPVKSAAKKVAGRGPGRPKGSGGAASGVFLADASIAQLKAELKKREANPKKRGRPKGSGDDKPRKKKQGRPFGKNKQTKTKSKSKTKTGQGKSDASGGGADEEESEEEESEEEDLMAI